jgi:hypothetical protein
MANTYTNLHFHIVFSTKNRQPWITQDLESRLWEYLGGIARQNQMKALQIGGMEDHATETTVSRWHAGHEWPAYRRMVATRPPLLAATRSRYTHSLA